MISVNTKAFVGGWGAWKYTAVSDRLC